jgi:ABC-type multidrug transport system fused ATPase/permease subunit
VELLDAFKTTRALNREATERRKYWTTWMRSKRVDWTLFWIGFVQDNSINQYYNVFTGIVVPLVTIWWVIGEKMTVGEYMAAGWIVSQFLNPIQSLASFFQDLRTNLVYAERLLDTLEVEPDMVDEQHAHHLPARIEGRIQLEHVSYSYPGRPGVLHHIDLTIEPGQKVALVGPSGAGKSTLLGLICRFYNPTEGRVSIDGHDLRSLTRASLMAHIAVCLQDTIVLMGSVADNIWYGGRNPTQQQIEHAAKLAGIHDFIVSLPDGYDTQLGEGGQQLSGGQIQRIGLARALARDPRIILFDEVTSDMDPLLHREVLGTLRDACKGRTVIMVSHDLVDIMDADLIGVLDSTGEIAQRGRHSDLMAAPGLYREMWYEEAVGRGSGGVA